MQLLQLLDVHSYVRSMILLVCGMLLFNLPMMVYKIRLLMTAILYMFFCSDRTTTMKRTTTSVNKDDTTTTTTSTTTNIIPALQQRKKKTIYFVRHGESTWNDTFNCGNHRTISAFVIGFIPNLIMAMLYELYLLLSGKLDSWFYDSPLSPLGLQQVNDLASFLNGSKKNSHHSSTASKQQPPPSSSTTTTNDDESTYQRHLSILRGDMGAPKSKLMASNLRRAVSTMIGGFHQRLLRQHQQCTTITSTTTTTTTTDKILIVPCLQEIGCNPDTLSITPPHTIIQASWLEQQQQQATSSSFVPCHYQQFYNTHTDMSLHTGNKPLRTVSTMAGGTEQRLMEFCEFVFSNSLTEYDYIIVGGHSLWFRTFFRSFILPHTTRHVVKEKKIVNGGIVCFDLVMTETNTTGSTSSTATTTTTPQYMIDPKSVQIIYGGF